MGNAHLHRPSKINAARRTLAGSDWLRWAWLAFTEPHRACDFGLAVRGVADATLYTD